MKGIKGRVAEADRTATGCRGRASVCIENVHSFIIPITSEYMKKQQSQCQCGGSFNTLFYSEMILDPKPYCNWEK